MRAMILAAGRGIRMGALTASCPKVLLPVRGKPILFYHLMRLRDAGVKDVVINLAYLGDQIREAVGDGSSFGLNVHYSQEPEVGTLETAGGIKLALPLLGDEPFLVVSGDLFTDYPFEALFLEKDMLAKLILVDNPPYHPNGDFFMGSVKYTYSNIGIYHRDFFQDIPLNGYYRLGDLIREHIPSGRIKSEHYSGIWHNIGTPQDLESVNDSLRMRIDFQI